MQVMVRIAAAKPWATALPPTASGAESRREISVTGDWSPLGDEHRAPSTKNQAPAWIAHSAVERPTRQCQIPNANGTGWANQLTCSLAQLPRSTRGCASTKVKGQRSVKGGMERNTG